MIEYIRESIELIMMVLVLLSMIIGLFAKLTGSEKAKKLAEKINFYHDIVNEYVAKAEELKDFSGIQKKNWVMGEIKNISETYNKEFDPAMVSKLIDETILLTKKVNFKKK